MQLAVKSSAHFATNHVDQMADEVSRLELSGVKSSKAAKVPVNSYQDMGEEAIDSIAGKDFEKFNNLNAVEAKCSDMKHPK